jgi:hypothetical protein
MGKDSPFQLNYCNLEHLADTIVKAFVVIRDALDLHGGRERRSRDGSRATDLLFDVLLTLLHKLANTEMLRVEIRQLLSLLDDWNLGIRVHLPHRGTYQGTSIVYI